MAPARLGALTLAACAWLQYAQAAPQSPGDPFHLDAFGTFGIAASDRDQPRYRTDYINTNGIGTSPTTKIDSRAGLQLGWTLNNQVEIDVQGLLANNLNDQTRVQVSWAYVQAQLSPGWSVKIGRYRTPGYLYADTLDVGYAYPWVRPPVDLYTTAATFHSNDGLLLQYSRPLADGRLRIEPYVGRTAGDIDSGGSTPARLQLHRFGVAVSVTQGASEVFAALSHNREFVASTGYNQLLAQCRALGYAPCAEYDYNGTAISQIGLGLRHDDMRWMVASELTYDTPGNLANARQLAAYLSVGHYIGNVLPYVTYSRLHVFSPHTETRFGPLNPVFAARRANLPQQHTWSLGARWDVTPGIALKAQFDNVHPDAGSPGTFTAPLPAGVRSVNVLTAALDWTY